MNSFLDAVLARAESCGLTRREAADAAGPLLLSKAIEAVRGHRAGALLLLGPPGTGKTLAALRWLISPLLDPANWEYDGSRWFYRYPASVRSARTARSLAFVRQYDSGEVERLVAARALVLDDLGQEYLDKSGFLASLVDHVVTERHRRCLPTVITANLTFERFCALYGDRAGDRVGGERVVVCDGSSLRRGATGTRTVRGVDLNAAEARAVECDAAIRSKLLAAPALSRAVNEGVISHMEDGMTAEQVEARKQELARQLADWQARNAASG